MTSPEGTPARRDPDNRMILATGVAHLLNHAFLLLYPQFLVLLQREFGLGLFALGKIANLHYLAAGLGAVPAGWIADRFGPVVTIRVFLAGSSLCLLLVALAPGPLSLTVALTAVGAFCSLYHPAGLALLSLSARRLGRALGLHGVIGSVGISITPFVASILAQQIGWRACCVLFAVPGLVAAVKFPALPALGRGERPASAEPARRMSLDAETALVGGASWSGGSTAAPTPMRWRPLLFLYLAVTLTGFVYKGTITFLPARFASSDGAASLGAAGAVTSLALLVGMLGQYGGGLMSQRLAPAPLFAALIALSTPFLALVGTGTQGLAAAAAAGFALFHFAAQPVSNAYLARWVPAHRRSLGYGVYFTLSFGAGSFAASAAGYIAEQRGLPQVFPFLAVVSALSIAAIVGSIAKLPASSACATSPDRRNSSA